MNFRINYLLISLLFFLIFPGILNAQTGVSVTVCETECAMQSSKAEKNSHMDSKSFRKQFPKPDGLETFLKVYKSANEILFERVKNGLRTKVRLFENGHSSEGIDEYFSENPRKYREIRENYESILIGKTNCTKAKNDIFKCEETETDVDIDLDAGLPALTPASILSIAESTVSCASNKCKSYVIDQAETIVILGQELITTSPLENHYKVTLIVASDGSPYSYKQVQWINGIMSWPEVHYYPVYEEKVSEFQIPNSQ